jgi:hypothetical protein
VCSCYFVYFKYVYWVTIVNSFIKHLRDLWNIFVVNDSPLYISKTQCNLIWSLCHIINIWASFLQQRRNIIRSTMYHHLVHLINSSQLPHVISRFILRSTSFVDVSIFSLHVHSKFYSSFLWLARTHVHGSGFKSLYVFKTLSY